VTTVECEGRPVVVDAADVEDGFATAKILVSLPVCKGTTKAEIQLIDSELAQMVNSK
jgi:hypothetical protein